VKCIPAVNGVNKTNRNRYNSQFWKFHVNFFIANWNSYCCSPCISVCCPNLTIIIWDVLIAIISRNILRKFLGWQSLIRHACQFKWQNVQRIIYQDLSGNKFATVFLAISRISAGAHERLSSIFVFCDLIWIKQKATLKTWSNFHF
jgi:hypothetical protein